MHARTHWEATTAAWVASNVHDIQIVQNGTQAGIVKHTVQTNDVYQRPLAIVDSLPLSAGDTVRINVSNTCTTSVVTTIPGTFTAISIYEVSEEP